MTPVGFEHTQLALVELESTPLDHSGKVSMEQMYDLIEFGLFLVNFRIGWVLYVSSTPHPRVGAREVFFEKGAPFG